MARYPKNSSPKLTKELIDELTSVIKIGAYIETAVAYCGISKDTFYRWLKEARSSQASELHLELSDALARAFAETEVRDLHIINQTAMGIPKKYAMNEDGSAKLDQLGFPVVEIYEVLPNWKAAAWRLQKRHPEHWGKNAKGVRADSIITEEPLTPKEQEEHDRKRRGRIKQFQDTLNQSANEDIISTEPI